MDLTFIQRRIEYMATNGLGYNTRTVFIIGRKKQFLGMIERFAADYIVSEDEVKHSPEGLRTHLYELYVRSVVMPRMQPLRDFLATEPWYKHLSIRYALARGYPQSDMTQLRNHAIIAAARRNLSRLKLNGRPRRMDQIITYLMTYGEAITTSEPCKK